MLSAFVNYGFGLEGIVIALFENLVPQCMFAAGAFVSLAFVKPPRLDRSVKVLIVPLLIAGGIGAVVHLVYRLIYLGIRSAFEHGPAHSINVGSLVSNVILLTIAVALGAVILRARLWKGELVTGASARQNTVVDALIIAGLVVAEFVVTGLFTGLFYVFTPYGGFNVFGTELLRGVFVGGAVLLVLAVIRPLSRVRSISSVIVTALIVVGASFVVMAILQVIMLAIEGMLQHVFYYVFFLILWGALDTGILVALAIFVILALRGERVATAGWSVQS